jgi:AraC-like DNA-binding protein
MKIYISGNTNLHPTLLKEQYRIAAREIESLNHEPVNPFDLLPSGELPPWPQRLEILSLQCHGIYLIDGWQKSEQASTERYMCRVTGKEIFYQVAEQERAVADEQKATAVERIKEAIHEATGMTIEQYRTRSRKEDYIFARMIFSHHSKRAGLSPDEISLCLHISRSMIYHYFERYNDECRFTPKFRCMAKKVDKFLSV